MKDDNGELQLLERNAVAARGGFPAALAMAAAESVLTDPACPSLGVQADSVEQTIPDYLREHYWWAYVHPNAVRFFEREWLVDLILWGNYRRLRDAALAMLGDDLSGRTLQVACVYGDLTVRLAAKVEKSGGDLDVVDVLPVQIANLGKKLPTDTSVRILRQNSAALSAPDGHYDRAVLFFLLHEQPREVRAKTIDEALRVVRPGGQIVIVDFAQPVWWQPLRYLWLPVLSVLEPFAPDLWSGPHGPWTPPAERVQSLVRRSYFGGMYQLISMIR